ncbi:MAG: peptide-methionine (S)-S-oxide reductase MsrA [Streptococcus sp.]
MVQPFEEQEGILSVRSGYTEDMYQTQLTRRYVVKRRGTPRQWRLSLIQKLFLCDLVEIYWAQTDPTDAFGQFEDRGDNYRPVIYYFDERQKKIAEQSKANLQASGRFDRPIVTKIEPAETFYEAEAYHQGFYKTNPERYAQSTLFVTNF